MLNNNSLPAQDAPLVGDLWKLDDGFIMIVWVGMSEIEAILENGAEVRFKTRGSFSSHMMRKRGSLIARNVIVKDSHKV